MSWENLDRVCARYGWQIAEQVRQKLGNGTENHVTRSLGVLQEDGVYAFFLYQDSRKSENEGPKRLEDQARELLQVAQIEPFTQVTDPLEAVRGSDKVKGLADDLSGLLLAKRLLQQALIYARYHAKAMEE